MDDVSPKSAELLIKYVGVKAQLYTLLLKALWSLIDALRGVNVDWIKKTDDISARLHL